MATRLPPTRDPKSEAGTSHNSQASRMPVKLRNTWKACAQLPPGDNPAFQTSLDQECWFLQINSPYMFPLSNDSTRIPKWLISAPHLWLIFNSLIFHQGTYISDFFLLFYSVWWKDPSQLPTYTQAWEIHSIIHLLIHPILIMKDINLKRQAK